MWTVYSQWANRDSCIYLDNQQISPNKNTHITPTLYAAQFWKQHVCNHDFFLLLESTLASRAQLHTAQAREKYL